MFNQIDFGLQSLQVEHLTQSELSVILQLRNMQQQRMQCSQVPGANVPLGMVIHEGRRYLEIRRNFSPIMVPTHLLNTVREFLANNLPQRLRVAPNVQTQSPPQSPPYTSPLYMPMSPPAMVPQSPPNTSLGMSFQLGDSVSSSLSSPNLGVSMPLPSSISFTEPMPIPQANSASSILASPSLPSIIPAASLSSAMPSAGFNVAMSSSPPNSSSFMETEDILVESADAENMQARKKHKSRSPSTGGSNKITKRSAATKSRKAQKANRRNNVTNGNAGSGSGIVVKQEDSGNEDNETEGCYNDLLAEEDSDGNGDGDDGDDADEADDKSNKLESEEEELRKPANAFILYRQQKNQNLRAEKPGISVEAASAIIGKCWREENKEVKEKYHEMAMKARDQYFAKKKRIQARQKQKKMEREELAQMQHGSRNPQKTRRQASGSNFVSQLVVSDARELSSFAPEALAQGPLSAMSHQEFSALQIPQPRLARALTVNIGSRFMTSSSSFDNTVLGNSAALGMTNHSGLTPAMSRMNTTGLGLGLGLGLESKNNNNNNSIDSYFADSRLSAGLSVSQDISQQVSSSMAELRNAFGSSQPQSSGSAMAVDQPISASSPPSSGSNVSGSVADSSAIAWGQTEENDSSGFSSMLSSLFRKEA
ncbi:hypothetical protein FB639_003418 [Coemansia asiatica]|nr:hypothetical protein FB639_003418 [Coemansia asiatica]